MKLEISINNVQQIRNLAYSVDLSDRPIVCIAGRNGSGKTTLVKVIKNLISADTFVKTSASRIFREGSSISYRVDGTNVVFKYDSEKRKLESRDVVPYRLRRAISVELPIPHGDRFNFFEQIREMDTAIRSQIVMQRFSRPVELIEFLSNVYETQKFNDLVQVNVKSVPYYVIAFPDSYYLREDYFSSGEYFLINLYRRITAGYSAIFIDEIDISLDAAAQVRLVEWLRKFHYKYKTTFVFTTHSLAMMRMLSSDELYYMATVGSGATTIEPRSYAYIKSTLFGFTGWDKYILTEDTVLKEFLDFFILKFCKPSFFQFKTIFVGGGTNTTSLMQRNATEKFFSKEAQDVIVVLDGDQRNKRHARDLNVFCIPVESIEKELLSRCLLGEFWDIKKFQALIEDHERLLAYLQKNSFVARKNPFALAFFSFLLIFRKRPLLRRKVTVARGLPASEKDFKFAGKRLYKHLIDNKIYASSEIFGFIVKKNGNQITKLQSDIENFLS
ncbi:AAA family ATPase [Massilia suwonensis]|uniref:AAA family ATPase n=1 Tax=Massilia suwonensis TaxID=648895 RepID=A0ABW0MPQ8_9BURK